MFTLGKFSLIILTRCNLRCRLCCEYVPQSKSFPDMTEEQEKAILKEAFRVADHISTLHLTGGGEPFLHPQLAEFIENAMEYKDHFDRLMLFTNGTVTISEKLLSVITKYKDKILVQVSRYGIYPEKEEKNIAALLHNGVNCKIEKYYGENQSFDGWIDFGSWKKQGKAVEQLEDRFGSCSVTSVLKGNWRTRDGKVHWCSRSQRGMELGHLPDIKEDSVDLFDETMSIEEKRQKFHRIEQKRYISACDYCSGDAGTKDVTKRYPAAEQL